MMVMLRSNADEVMKYLSTGWGHPLANRLWRGWYGYSQGQQLLSMILLCVGFCAPLSL